MWIWFLYVFVSLVFFSNDGIFAGLVFVFFCFKSEVFTPTNFSGSPNQKQKIMGRPFCFLSPRVKGSGEETDRNPKIPTNKQEKTNNPIKHFIKSYFCLL